jgi:hypothetical protein
MASCQEAPLRPRFRRFLCFLTLALGVATLYLLARGNLAQRYQGPGTDPKSLLPLDPPFEEESQWAKQRWEAKQQVTCVLLEGRLTLREAAARFRDIDVGIPLKAQPQRPPQYREEEWACRQVIAYVHDELAGIRQAPAQVEVWVTRLEVEFQKHFRHGGDPPAAPGP